MNIMRVGVDLAKNVFHVHGVDGNEQPVWRRRLTRGEMAQDAGGEGRARLRDWDGGVCECSPLGA